MKILARLISLIFHPLLLLTYVLVIMLTVHPYGFGVNRLTDQGLLILYIFFSTFLLPLFAALMMKWVGFAKSLELKTRHERIGPYIAAGIFYLWIFVSIRHNTDIPETYKIFILGATIGLFIAFFVNNFSKISAHAVGMGGLVAMVFIAMVYYYNGPFSISFRLTGTIEMNMLGLLMICIVLAGLVGSARLFLQAHSRGDLYGGYLVGFASQFLALRLFSDFHL